MCGVGMVTPPVVDSADSFADVGGSPPSASFRSSTLSVLSALEPYLSRVSDVIEWTTTRNGVARSLTHEASLQMLTFVTSRIYHVSLFLPTKFLYLSTPSVNGVGGWGSRRMADVCESMTGYNSVHWARHASACEELVDKRVESVVAVFFAVLYVLILSRLGMWAIRAIDCGAFHVGSCLLRCCLRQRRGKAARHTT